MFLKKKVLPHSTEESDLDSKESALPKSCCLHQRSSYDQEICKSSLSRSASAISHFKEGFHFVSLNQKLENADHWEGEGGSLQSRSRELSQGGDGCSLSTFHLCARQRKSQAVRAGRAGGTPKPAVGQDETHLSGLGSFFLSRECRIILHFPMTASGRDIPMPLNTSL